MPKQKVEDSPEVQWSGLGTSTAGIMGSIPGRGTRIPQIVQCSHKKGVGEGEQDAGWPLHSTTFCTVAISRENLTNQVSKIPF